MEQQLDDVIAQLQSAGLVVDGLPLIGKLQRCRVDDERGNKRSGWYVLHELRLDSGDVVFVGSYGNWRRFGDEVLKVDFKGAMSEAERQRLEHEQKLLRERAAAERLERNKQAAERAERIWRGLPASGKSPYLDKKQVRGFGVRYSRGSLVVPVRNAEYALVGLQFIQADGVKKFLTGTPKTGGFHFIGSVEGAEVVAVAEGYATAASVHMATGWPVAVAFDCGNLMPVAKMLREKLPELRLVIAADNDTQTQGNPGLTKASSCAQALGGVVALPSITAVQNA